MRKGIVDNRLLKVADTFDIQRRRNHEVDLRSRVKLHESLGHLDVVGDVLLFIPVLWFGVVGTQLDDNDIRLRVEGGFVGFSLGVWHISCFDHASPGLTIVLDLERFKCNFLLHLNLVDLSPSLIHIGMFMHDHGHLV